MLSKNDITVWVYFVPWDIVKIFFAVDDIPDDEVINTSQKYPQFDRLIMYFDKLLSGRASPNTIGLISFKTKCPTGGTYIHASDAKKIPSFDKLSKQ